MIQVDSFLTPEQAPATGAIIIHLFKASPLSYRMQDERILREWLITESENMLIKNRANPSITHAKGIEMQIS